MTDKELVERVAITNVARWREYPGLSFEKAAAEWAKWDDACKRPWREVAEQSIRLVLERAAGVAKEHSNVRDPDVYLVGKSIANAILALGGKND